MNCMKSAVDPARALAYLADHLKGSLLCRYLPSGALQRDCQQVELVSSCVLPENSDFRRGYGANGQAAEDWLVSEIVEHLQADSRNLAIVEDVSGRPTDAGIADGAAGSCWVFQDRVLWPITQDMIDPALVRQAWLWALSGSRQVVAFGRYPGLKHLAKDALVSEEFMHRLGDEITQLAVDAFDGEAFLVWRRKRG